MTGRLVECSDNSVMYGTLSVTNVTVSDVQNKITEIKNRFYDEGINDWTVEDVLAELPEDWDWRYTSGPDDVIEI